jgi:hypothetical protein
LASEARRAGGWFNFWLGEQETQKFTRAISRWAGYDEDNPYCPECVEGIRLAFSYDAWADMICRFNLVSDQGTSFISRSGYTSIDVEGEKKLINPCPNMGVDSYTLPNGTVISCQTYYQYKISGEAVPAEMDMEFDVYLNGRGSGVGYDEETDMHLYGGQKVKLNRSGAPWSLSGPNMFVYETYYDFDKVCIQFTGDSFTKLQMIMPVLYDSDNPYCNNIKDAFVSQTAAEKAAEGAAILSPTLPSGPAPSGAGAGGGGGGTGPRGVI